MLLSKIKLIRKAAVFLAVILAVGCIIPVQSFAWGENVKIYVNEKFVEFPAGATPYLDNDTTMIPVRAVSEALDASVFWFEDEKRVQITKYDTVLSITLGLYQMSEYQIVNGVTQLKANIDMPVPAIQHAEDRGECVYVPLRVIAEALDAGIVWNDKEQAVYLKPNAGYKKWYNEMTVQQIAKSGTNNLFKTTGEILMIEGIPYLWDGEDFNNKIQITESGVDAWYAFFPDRDFASVKVEMSAVTGLGDTGEVIIPFKRTSTTFKMLSDPVYKRTPPPAFNFGGISANGELLNINFFYGFWNSNNEADYSVQKNVTYRYDYVLDNKYMGGYTVYKGKTSGSIGCHASVLDGTPKVARVRLYSQKDGEGISIPTVFEVKLWRNEAVRRMYVELPYGEVKEIVY